VIEAAMIWNEPNNMSHWDFEVDKDWSIFARMAAAAGDAIKAERPDLPRVLGGISPIDPGFIANMDRQGVLDHVDVVAVHGFPLDWNHWMLDDWPAKIAEIRAATSLPIWISEVGVSTFGAEEVQEFGLRRTHELLRGLVPRVHWYSLYDLPKAWPATTRHHEAEGSSYYRHFYMGLLREDGTPKRAARLFHECNADFGICQWFHFEDYRLDDAVCWLKKLGVKQLRTGLSWGRLAPAQCRGLVRSPDERARAIRRHAHLLLHARKRGPETALHQPAARHRRVRRLLRNDDQALRVVG
jgi:beta-xylosidase